MYVGVARPEVVDVRGLVVRRRCLRGRRHGIRRRVHDRRVPHRGRRGSVPSVGGLAIVGLLVAATFHPMQVVLRGVVDELLFGHRPDPLDAAAGVVGSIGDDPVLALRAIREALVLPYAALRLDDEVVAESGAEVTHTRTLALALDNDGGRARGRPAAGRPRALGGRRARARGSSRRCWPRRCGPTGSPRTSRSPARQTDHRHGGGTPPTPARPARRARSTAVRDRLHVRRGTQHLRSDPDATDELLATLRAETGTAIDEIRRLVYAMRPPALDELGLVPALRQQAVSLRTTDGMPLRVTITADEVPRSVAAAVEVAAYRIVMEALTNVARHSGSDRAEVALQTAGPELVIDVTDDGTAHGSWSTGVGIASMRERAAQLGGTLTAGSNGRGGRVHAVLPLG